MSADANARFYADENAPICPLVVKEFFDALSPDEQRYAYHIGRASWLGARVILKQTTPHASDLYDMLRYVFSDKDGKLADMGALRAASGLDEAAWTHALEYTAQVFGNLANFKSFGDIKIIPRVSEADVRRLVDASANRDKAGALFDKVKGDMYSTTPAASTLLGFPDQGHVTHYYSADVTQDDIKAVQGWADRKGVDQLNTRLWKRSDGSLELRVASAETRPEETVALDGGREMHIVHGDYAHEMKAVADELAQAVPFAANETQKKMLQHYVKHFQTGSVAEYEASQREWVRDIGPNVESNIGFVETYRDPAGVRAEWEGFVAAVNQEQTRKFEKMVNRSPEFIPKLPWPKEFEKDKFLKPDFTSLEIISFSTGGVPAGINIPNLDGVRQDYGFKNVSLGNVLNAKAPNETITFLSDEDAALYDRLRGPAFEVQVGIHELLGHGTGKLFIVDADGKANFDEADPPIDPLTSKPITSWYKAGETWGSVFKTISSSYEECRAECVAMYLACDKDMLAIFGHTDASPETADDVLYVSYLMMARAGLLALEHYDPAANKWGQAHMQARYAILKCFLDAGEGFVRIIEEEDDLRVVLDRTKILSVGRPAVGRFLLEQQVFKSTADAAAGHALYARMTAVPDAWIRKHRNIVLAKKQPRKLLLQANMQRDGDTVRIKEYDADLPGFIQSYLERDI